jgi:xanthine dehydrogenase accessory factor
MALVLVRGAGDVGSAVAHVLFAVQHRVVLHDNPMPSHARRGMSFTDALYRGKAELEGTLGKYARTVADIALMVQCHRAIPVTDMPLQYALSASQPDVLVDARMQKHRQPEPQRGLAPLTVGLGPNFVAGQTTDVVVETAWGERLGAVIRAGRALDLAGEPRAIDGHTRDRFVYSPLAGKFQTRFDIGAVVVAGEEVGRIGNTPFYAPLSGCLRGLAQDGARVEINTKIIEVDPRSSIALVRGLGERPKKIADAVLRVVTDREANSAKPPNRQP